MPSNSLSSIDKQPATQRLVQRLRQNIIHGHYAPGQRLRESDLVNELESSKAPIREAMQVLSFEGIVKIEHHRGFVVTRLSRKDFRDIYQLLEPLAAVSARNAAREISSGKKAPELKAALDAIEWEVETGNIIRFIEAVDRWREIIDHMGDNDRLPEMIAQLCVPLFRLQIRNLIKAPEIPQALQAYREITQWIMLGDEFNAEKRTREHLQRSAALIDSLPEEYFN